MIESILNIVLPWGYIITASVILGLTVEIVFTAISPLFDGYQKGEEKLMGEVSLWMALVYGIMLPVLYIPMLEITVIKFDLPFYIRYVIWALSIAGFELLAGWFFDRGLFYITKGKLSVRPWNYSYASDSYCNGYGRWKYIPIMGLIGLAGELYMYVVKYTAGYAAEHVKLFFHIGI